MAAASVHFCANHPETHAVARCVSCRKQICHPCSTRWEGINYCVSCLQHRAGRSGGPGDAAWAVTTVALSAFLLWALWKVSVIVGVWIVSLS
jgi:hypothetical protein